MKKLGTILVTGANGALGPPLVAELLEGWERVAVVVRDVAGARELFRSERVVLIKGDVREMALEVGALEPRSVAAVIHAAADTRFRAGADELEVVNVRGSENVLGWARKFPSLRRFVHVSTTCVAGTRTGRIVETMTEGVPEFLNAYEASKWRSERVAAASGLPVTIARLSTVIGSERTGTIHRTGAIHRAMQWLYRGLVPMLPGDADTPVDLISSELAAKSLARCAAAGGGEREVIHISAGEGAIPLGELIELAVEEFREVSAAWRQGQIRPPMIVDRETFAIFRESIDRSGDVLFRSVLDSTAAFLPGLLYPKVFETTRAQRMLGGALPTGNLPALVRRVIRQCICGAEPMMLAREVCDV